jgi:hypothetical protein
MDGSSLGLREKADAMRMMRSDHGKLIFPWPKNENREEYLEHEGFSPYVTTDALKWLVTRQNEVNFEGCFIYSL